MVLISLKVSLIDGSRILNFSSIIFIEGMWNVALALAVITISGSTFHPLFLMLSISAWYFPSFRVIVSGKNLLVQYVNSMNYILKYIILTSINETIHLTYSIVDGKTKTQYSQDNHHKYIIKTNKGSKTSSQIPHITIMNK